MRFNKLLISMRPRLLLVALVISAGVTLLAGCGSSSSKQPQKANATTTTAASSATASPGPVSLTSLQSCLQQAGDSVTPAYKHIPHIISRSDLSTITALTAYKGVQAEITIDGTAVAAVYKSVADGQAADSQAKDPRLVVSNNVLWATFGSGGSGDISTCAEK